MTSALLCPGAVTVKVAAPVPDAAAATVTFCGVDQFDGVNVRLAPLETLSPVLPVVRATVTVTLAEGAVDKDTSKTPDLPCCTPSWAGVATTAGPATTVIPAGVDSADAPRPS